MKTKKHSPISFNRISVVAHKMETENSDLINQDLGADNSRTKASKKAGKKKKTKEEDQVDESKEGDATFQQQLQQLNDCMTKDISMHDSKTIDATYRFLTRTVGGFKDIERAGTFDMGHVMRMFIAWNALVNEVSNNESHFEKAEEALRVLDIVLDIIKQLCRSQLEQKTTGKS